jgi:type I restriction enzyme S subunit
MLLFTGSGETVEDIGKCVVYLGDEVAYAGGDVIIFEQFGNDSLFLSYALNTDGAKYEKARFARGDIIVHTYASKLKNIYISVPPLSEQTVIANYLDRKTAEIDQTIADKEALIGLYEEEKKGLINEAVTKGLNPNVPLKPSGIEWLGNVPEHWEVVPLTKYLESIVDYRGRTPNKIKEGVFLVTAKNIKNGIIDYSLSEEYVSREEHFEFMKRGEVNIGDVLFTTEAPLGEVANIDRVDICLAQRVIKFRGIETYINNYFLKYWLRSPSFQQDLQTYATGSTALGIKASKLNNLLLTLPPLSEQAAIVDYIETETAKINEKMTVARQEIALLKEFRQALIFECVTGKVCYLEEKIDL